ncbi:MAG: NifB/NifX family molybdenum-iron cluster-binding protein [Deltaproteobacteria bacterium]|nr:NifB/NifX family molybdenum-iron cluster-binding protein [Deltaproteobacteria bacterium]
MKICIPTETGEGKTASVYGHFGSAPYFTIYDTEAQALEVVDNVNSHHEHGTCNPIAALQGRAVDVVVTGGMGARAVMMLNDQGIKVFRAVPGTVDTIIGNFSAQDLEELTVHNSCASHGCH